MAIPSSGYSTADFTNPAADLTDFVAVVDLSDMPADFWTTVNSSDGARGRVAKDDGTTELASEWVEFDDVAETGFVFFKWSGTLASTGTSTVRIYPPQSGNSSYAVTATYGRNAVWSDYISVWHMEDAAGTDATGNGHTISWTNASTVAGKIGTAIDASSTVSVTEGTVTDADAFSLIESGDEATFTFWAQETNNSSDSSSVGRVIIEKDDEYIISWDESFPAALRVSTFGGNNLSDVSNNLSSGTWHYNAVKWTAGTSIDVKVDDNTTENSLVTDTSVNATSDLVIAVSPSGAGQSFEGYLDEIRITTVKRPDDWLLLEYSNQNNPTTFWGTWTWNSGTTTTTLQFDQGSYSVTGQTIGFIQTDVLPFNQGSYSVNGQDIGLREVQVLAFEQGTYTITDSTVETVEIDVLDFEQGSYAITGQNINLILTSILSFDQGSYAVSGQDIDLRQVRILSVDQGTYNITGQDIGFVQVEVLDFQQGTYAITGQDFRIVINSPEILTLDSTIATLIELDSKITTELDLDSEV